MKTYLQNNRGMTLVEILAALVILSLVLIASMTYFTQSARFTMHNKETLTEVQVAEAVVAKIREKNSFENLIGITKNNVIVPNEKLKGNKLLNDTYKYALSGYQVTITLSDAPSSVKDYLRKVNISVIPKENVKMGKRPFITDMYFEVSTP